MREAIDRLRGSRRRSRVTVVQPRGSLLDHSIERAHEALDEVPGILRGFRTFLLVASISMVVFAVGIVFVIWRAVG